MRNRKVFGRVAGLAAAATLTAISLTACAGPAFDATKAKSTPIVQALYDSFDLAGYTKSPIGGGHWGIDSGGDPNMNFTATYTTNKIDAVAQCEAVDAYVRSISSSQGSVIQQKRAIPNCIAELKSYYSSNGGFMWHAKYKGAPVLVQLDKSQYGYEGEPVTESVKYTITVMTVFTQGTSGLADCPECLMQEPDDRNLVRYLNGLEDYRNAKGFDFFTAKTIADSGVVGKTSTTTMTPVADEQGRFTRLKVEWANGRMNVRCYSLLPWSKKLWGIDDPGAPRPMMTRHTLTDLVSFGQYMYDSDCVVDDVFNSSTPSGTASTTGSPQP